MSETTEVCICLFYRTLDSLVRGADQTSGSSPDLLLLWLPIWSRTDTRGGECFHVSLRSPWGGIKSFSYSLRPSVPPSLRPSLLVLLTRLSPWYLAPLCRRKKQIITNKNLQTSIVAPWCNLRVEPLKSRVFTGLTPALWMEGDKDSIGFCYWPRVNLSQRKRQRQGHKLFFCLESTLSQWKT